MADDATTPRPAPAGMRALGGDQFSMAEATGGWRGFAEAALPGIAYVTAFVIAGGYRVPVIAAVAVMVVTVGLRLIQRTPVQHALGGAVGVAIGAFVAWQSGDAKNFYVAPFFLYAGYGLAMIVSMVVRWPVVGLVVGLLRGTGKQWRSEPGGLRRATYATGVIVAVFVIRLATQVPLYLADATAELGVVKLVTGTPLFALALWAAWFLVRNVGRQPAPSDQPPATE